MFCEFIHQEQKGNKCSGGDMYHGISQGYRPEVYILPQLAGKIQAYCRLLNSSTVHKRLSILQPITDKRGIITVTPTLTVTKYFEAEIKLDTLQAENRAANGKLAQ